MRKLLSNTIVLLLLAVVAGILAGFFIPEAGMKGVLVLKQISGQIIFFLVPLIIIGFVAPSIASLKGSVSRLIVFAFSLAYLSSVGAAFFAMLVGYQVISLLDIRPVTGSLRELPEVLFSLEIPPHVECDVRSAILGLDRVGMHLDKVERDCGTALAIPGDRAATGKTYSDTPASIVCGC